MKSGAIIGLVCVAGSLLAVRQAGGVPVVAAPAVRECAEAKVTDLGLWDDLLRFQDQDFILLRKKEAVFSCSMVSGAIKKIETMPHLGEAEFAGGLMWGRRQWVFFQSAESTPLAVDLSSGKTARFEIPGVKAGGEHVPAISEVVHSGSGPGAIVAITPYGAAGWPRTGRDDNAPLYFWMNLQSGDVKPFPAGWDLDYFSADQKRVVFEKPSTNQWMYRPWVTVEMSNGEVTDEPPDQTKGIWATQLPGYWDFTFVPWLQPNPSARIWELRSAQTPAPLGIPQPGRGRADDRFAGLAVNGVVYPFTVNARGMDRSPGARASGNLAAVALQPDGASGNFLWVKKLRGNEPAVLLATNCEFELVGERGCAWTQFREGALLPDAFFYDVHAGNQWNVFADLPVWARMAAALRDTNAYAGFGAGPMSSTRLVAGFGSQRYLPKVLCAFTQTGIVADNMTRMPVQRLNMLLTSQGRRYQIHLPASVGELPMSQAWLHNSGKLVIGKDEYDAASRAHWRLYLVDLKSD